MTEPNWDHIDFPPYGKRPLRAFQCGRCGGVWWSTHVPICSGFAEAPHDQWLMDIIDRDGVPREQTPGLVAL